MMKKNVWKFLKSALLGLAVIIVCILLILQCPGDKTTRENASIQPSVETVKEKPVETKKQDLSDSPKLTQSETETPFARKKPIHKPNKIIVKHEAQSNVSSQNNESVGKNTNSKVEDLLFEEVKALSEQVDSLRDKVRILLEKVEAVLKKKKMNTSVEGVDNLVVEKEEVQTGNEVTFKYPTHVLTAGISTYKDWTPYGFQGSYDYRISKYFSLGLQGNAFFKEGKFQADRSIYVGLRANLHIFPLLVKDSNFDLYAGGSLGAGRDDAVATFETMGYLGASYDFSRRWGIFAEAGNIGVVGLRLKFNSE